MRGRLLHIHLMQFLEHRVNMPNLSHSQHRDRIVHGGSCQDLWNAFPFVIHNNLLRALFASVRHFDVIVLDVQKASRPPCIEGNDGQPNAIRFDIVCVCVCVYVCVCVCVCVTRE